jgi:hypothetical protein
MDSGQRDLKNILVAIPSWTSSDLSWEAYPRLGPSEKASERMSQVATWTFNLYITFLVYSIIGLTSPASIYSQASVFCPSVLKSNSFTPDLLSCPFPYFQTLVCPSEIRTLGTMRAQHIS